MRKRRKVEYIHKAPESAYFEGKGPGAGDKKRWRAVPPVLAAGLLLLAFILLAFLNTYRLPGEPARQAVASQTEMEPPLHLLAQWRPSGHIVLVFSDSASSSGHVERWVVDGDGTAVLERTFTSDPRPVFGFLKFIGYGGILLCLVAIASMVRDRGGRAVVARRDRYTPPEFRQRQ